MDKKVLIIGESKINHDITVFFTQKECRLVYVDDVYAIRALDGQVGDFTLRTKHTTELADFVIVSEQPCAPPVIADSLAMFSVYDSAKELAAASSADKSSPIVFLLDYISESPLSATIQALRSSIQLAQVKRKVFYLSKFIRTGGKNVEQLYRQAREMGVTFIKYESLNIKTDNVNETFSFAASDGVIETLITSHIVFSDGSNEVGERFSHVTKSLNLTTTELGFLSEDRFFLTPVLTSRRGVYHITRNLAAEDLEYALNLVYSHASNPNELPSAFGKAIVNGEKCVLCYNCHRACTHAALTPDSDSRHMHVLNRACNACGTCVAICPGSAIELEFKPYSSDKSGKTNKALILCCENSAADAVDKALTMLSNRAADIEAVTVPCGGIVDVDYLTTALLSYHKIMAAICIDDACRHFNGSYRACKQVSLAHEILSKAGLPTSRLHIAKVSPTMPIMFKDNIVSMLDE